MQFWAYIFGIWTVLTFLQAVLAQAFMDCKVVADVTATEQCALNTVLQFNVFNTTEIFGAFSIPTPNLSFFPAVARLLIWDFDLFTGAYGWVRWGLLLPLGGALGFGLVRDVGPVLLDAIATARNFFKL